MGRIIHSTLHSTLLLGLLATPAAAFNLKPIGTYSTGIFDDGAAKISAYDPMTQRLFVTNGSTNQINVLGLTNPTSPSLLFNIDLDDYGGEVNSVAFSNGLFAVAVQNTDVQAPGHVLFFEPDGKLLNSIAVGALPDALTFTPDGMKLLVANEAQPSDDYTIDPEGSVSIIDTSNWSVVTAGFNGVNLSGPVRIFGPNASIAQDLEPEYIAVSDDSTTAWVTLQENNAIGILDIANGVFTDVVGLGFKDHSLPGNGLDASDRDDAINIATYPNLFGMYQPDEIAAYSVGEKTYLVTANEGDSREYVFEDETGEEQVAFIEEATVADLTLDPNAFPNAADLQADEVLGRLEVTNTLGDTDGDGDFEELYAFGGRSFSIWDEQGNLIFDSGDQFEQITAKLLPDFFNSNNSENQSFDNRSDNKGPEPEGVTLAQLFDRIYAFIGLERIGGIMAYDITDPFNPFFVDYTNNRDFSVMFDLDEEGDPAPTPEQLAAVGDLGPEGLLFIPAEDSPNRKPLLVVANEVSGTTTIYEVKVPEPASVLGLLVFSALGGLVLKRKSQTTV
ncbi:MAG: choice-of-anchor I family protein [Coleofasciculus sp. S288]|nr:choice-of-anchor I family protein [Coleofasciculus sp. S288]